MRESAGMLSRRRRESRNHAAPRLPDTIARLVTFTILTRTAGGRPKTTRIRVLTTLPATRSSRPGRSLPCIPKGGKSKSRSCI
ncbi:MAG: hypothetical protein ACRDND_32185 [Streptosporangiaceae bacterium]